MRLTKQVKNYFVRNIDTLTTITVIIKHSWFLPNSIIFGNVACEKVTPEFFVWALIRMLTHFIYVKLTQDFQNI